MKALTLWEPWASLMSLEAKKVETRCWNTRYRGPIAIHAAKNIPSWLGESRKSQDFHDAMVAILNEHAVDLTTTKGCVLCIADLVAVASTNLVRDDLSEQEQLFGNYEEGRYAWFFENVRRLERPLAVKGNRMLWNWNPEDRIIRLEGGANFTVPES